tara:strand:- start:217 stop:801 length:585 start_codon:yes stop_codon:yes gene_type:complete
MKNNEIFIPFNVSSSKNSKQWTGKYLINSKATRTYIKNSKKAYQENKNKFIELTKNLEKPLHISFFFIRNSRRKFDYINPAQTVQDLMVKYGWIEDDDIYNLVPHFHGYKVDKENPGVLIKVLNMSEENGILWGFEEPEYMRSKEHRKFLIEQYNRNRPAEEHVHNMTELNRALLTNEINALSNGKGDTQDKAT